jgi:hypothetical protein
MTRKISKTNDDLAYFYSRLDEVLMSDYERLKAKAQMARAEAVADFVAAVFRGIGRLFHGSDKPSGHAAPSAG